jgi:ferric-dicitrate binding protein FerR (iron transport regulator)
MKHIDEPSEDDPVGRLLHIAGPRPPVPEAVWEGIRQVARPAWQAKVEAHRARRRRQRRGVFLLAAALVTAVGSGLFYRLGLDPFAPPSPVATVEAWFGAETAARTVGTLLDAGAELTTNGGSRVALRLAGGASLRLDHDTHLTFESASALVLHRGGVYLDSGPDASSETAVEVHTPFGIARDIGTQFEVRLQEGGLAVQVREGEVNLELTDATHQATAGIALAVGQDGAVERRTVPLRGPAWDWILASAPSFRLEGRPLSEYLDWVVRETGHTLRFEDAALAEQATTIIARGSLEGLRPDQTLDIVLPGSGLAYRLGEDSLLVERP